MSKPNLINPGHYVSEGSMESADVIEAFFAKNCHLAHAFKYMARAGKKPGNSEVIDLEKAKWWIERRIKYLGGSDVE